MEFINDFVRGGNSKSALAGRITGKVLRFSLVILIVILSAGIGQFLQVLSSYKDVRREQFSIWASGNAEREALVKRFTGQCLNKSSVRKTGELDMDKPVVLVVDCAEKAGATELLPVIESANAILTTYSWPLSLIAETE